jgi:hypothetical protein
LIVLDVAHIRDKAGILVKVDLVNVVPAHRVEAVSTLIKDILVVKEELVRL